LHLGGSPEPRTIWVRDERAGSVAKLRVVGSLDPRVSFPSGLYVAAPTIAQVAAPPPQRVAYYLKASAGADPAALAIGLNVSFGNQGLQATAIGEQVRQIQSVRELLNQLLEGFFGVGLLAGLAALGVTTMRSVIERRQQIGVLRAIGFRRQTVRLSLLLETALVGTLGIFLGTILGLALAARLVDSIGRQYPEIVFSVPWAQIVLTDLGALAAGLGLAALPIWQIGRISPTDALRYE
jgi:putative ABC transport system permease protein